MTSSGKTSIVDAIQEKRNILVVANDFFEQLIGDSYENQSAEQAACMARNIPYALRVETDKLSPEACAEIASERCFDF